MLKANHPHSFQGVHCKIVGANSKQETLPVQKQAQSSREGSAPSFRQSIGSEPRRGDRECPIHNSCFCMNQEQHAPDKVCKQATRMPPRAHLLWPLRFPAPGLRKRGNISCLLTSRNSQTYKRTLILISSQTAIRATAIRSYDIYVLLHHHATAFRSDNGQAHESVEVFRNSYIQAN